LSGPRPLLERRMKILCLLTSSTIRKWIRSKLGRRKIHPKRKALRKRVEMMKILERMMKGFKSQQEIQRRKHPQWLRVRKDQSLDRKRLSLMLDLRKLNLLQVHKRHSRLQAPKKDLRSHNLLLDHKNHNLLMDHKRLNQWLVSQALSKVLLLAKVPKREVPPSAKALREAAKLRVQPSEMEASMTKPQ
jgi:hypothetical protein